MRDIRDILSNLVSLDRQFKVDSDDETGWDKKESIAVLHLKDVSIYLMGRIALWEIQENALMDQTFFKGTTMSEPHLHQF